MQLARLQRKLVWIAVVAFRLGHDALSVATMVLGGSWLLITDRNKSRLRFQVRLAYRGETFSFTFEDLGDFGTLYEVFIEEVYRLNTPATPKVIFDLGSNIGASVIYFRLRYPDATIYCFEPDPAAFRRLVEHTRMMDGVRASPYAVWSKNGAIRFYADPHRSNSSSCSRRRGRQEPITVEARTLDTLMTELGVDTIDLLKFDVEGAEAEILDAFEGLPNVRVVLGEVHADMTKDVNYVVDLLSGHHRVDCRSIAPDRYSCEAHLREGRPTASRPSAD